MELLVPILIYLGYSMIAAIMKKFKNEYQEPDLAPYTAKEKQEQEKAVDANKQLLNEEKNSAEERNEIEDSVVEMNKQGTAELELEKKRRKLEARKAEAEKKQREVKEKLKVKQEKTSSVSKQSNEELNIRGLNRSDLRQGVIIAEILQSPRAKRPYQAKGSLGGRLNKGEDD